MKELIQKLRILGKYKNEHRDYKSGKEEQKLNIWCTPDFEREINRLGNVKGSEDILGIAIDMARKGEDRESIKKNTGLREDEVEAIYTYYRK